DKGLSPEDQAVFKNVLESRLIPHLQSKQSDMIRSFLSKNNSASVREILNVLQTLSKPQTFQQIDQFLRAVKTNEILFALPPKEQFLQQLNDVFTMGAISGKHVQSNDVQDATQTLKSLLYQLLQNSDGTVHEKASQLTHFLNGMQMQSV